MEDTLLDPALQVGRGVPGACDRDEGLDLRIWRCPQCHGCLIISDDAARCEYCAARYSRIGKVLDLRLPGASWIDYTADSATARHLAEEMSDCRAEELIRFIYRSRREWDDVWIAMRTQQVLAAPNRLKREVRGWLYPCVSGPGVFLDIGCGPGTLLAAAASEGWRGIGIDVSMVWLIVAERLITEQGGQPILAAAMAEALPLADRSVTGVVSLDVIEHVAAPEPYLREIDRVTADQGVVAIATPNRYSLAAEPHVAVWGVGWLPRSWQKEFVRRRSGKGYEFTRLLSVRETVRLFRQHTMFETEVHVPPVPDEEVARFPAYRAFAARLYNRLAWLAWTRHLLLTIGPFFHVVGTKTQRRIQ